MTKHYPKLLLEINERLKENLSQRRYEHIQGVEEVAHFIGKHYQLDLNKLGLSARLHDYAKYYSISKLQEYCSGKNISLDNLEKNSHGLLHGKVGRYLAEELFSIKDEEVLNSISSHTTGRVGMSKYEEIIFIADYCDPSRKLSDCVEIIDIAKTNLTEAVYRVCSSKLIYVIQTAGALHPRSVDVHNHYLALTKNQQLNNMLLK